MRLNFCFIAVYSPAHQIKGESMKMNIVPGAVITAVGICVVCFTFSPPSERALSTFQFTSYVTAIINHSLQVGRRLSDRD